MKFNYRFSNLLGSVYRKGNLVFSKDGNSILSPVGNRISIFDLKNNKSETLPVESSLNIVAMALSPDGNLLIAVNEDGEAMLINMRSRSILHYYHFHRAVKAICFSPDGKKFAVTKESKILVFHAPGSTKEFNPFVLYRTFYGAYDDTVSIDWTSDSRVFCAGGKDMNTRVYAAVRLKNLVIYSVGGHTDSIVNAFFDHNSLDFYSISRNSQLCVWVADAELADLQARENREVVQESTTEEDDLVDLEEDAEEKAEKEQKEAEEMQKEQEKAEGKLIYKRVKKHYYSEARGEGSSHAHVTSAAYHKPTHILCTGFSDGAFFLHEMPDFNLIHSLSMSDQSIEAIAFNSTGDWIGLGCSGVGQLLVWEWQSESYVMKQQAHFNNMSCLAYSPDGQFIATGGDDAKVKVWNTGTGFCFVTFSEHNAGITGVLFNQNGQVVLSASLDGTVRAFDLKRYRNFRTFTSPRPTQFASLALDNSGELVCAGSQDTFEIFVWSMQTGRLLEILAGHEGPISSLAFSPTTAILASGSWDKTVKVWDIFENKGAKENLQLLSDVLAVEFRPDGEELAVATLNAQISFWNVKNATQTGSVEGRHDLGYTRREIDKITAKKASFGKAFNQICYTADGKCILAGGRSKNVCIYSVGDQILVKKFEITCNRSLDGTQEFLDRRKMTEFGNLDLIDEGQGDDGQAIGLPGVRKGDLSSRHFKPEVRVTGVRFSPTGRAWAATTTEGLLVYSLDHNLVFDPFDLDIEVTPENVSKTLKRQEFSKALMLAFRLNEQPLILEAFESVPMQDIEHIVRNLPDVYVDKLLGYIGSQLETSSHIQFYLMWCQKLLYVHGPRLKQRSQSVMATLRLLLKNLSKGHRDMSKICDHNKYGLQYILTMAEHKQKQEPEAVEMESNLDSDSDTGSLKDLLAGMREHSDGVSDGESDNDVSMETDEESDQS